MVRPSKMAVKMTIHQPGSQVWELCPWPREARALALDEQPTIWPSVSDRGGDLHCPGVKALNT